MKSLFTAILLTALLFIFIWLLATGIDWLAHWKGEDVKFYAIVGFCFIIITISLYFELKKDKELKP